MDAGLAHFEVLGPRAGLDGWLATLQAAGTCHLADALVGLAGEPGIGRPRPREEERRAADLRAPVLLELRSLAAILPAGAARGGDPATRADAREWSLPPGGVDDDALAVRCEHVLAIARRIRRDLENVKSAAHDPQALGRAHAALATRLSGEGLDARRALEGLEDAEAREQAQRLLASTGHVTAARIYVPKDREQALLASLERAHSASVVARPLPLADDAPGPVRALPARPLAVLGALSPARFGEHDPLTVAVLFAVPLAAYLARDALVGLVLLLGGAALGAGARKGSPRRDAARLAFACGLLGLLAAGFAWRWSRVLPAWYHPPSASPWQPFWQGLAMLAFALALYAAILGLRHGALRDAARARRAYGSMRRLGLIAFLCLALGIPGAVVPAVATGVYAFALLVLTPLRAFGRVAVDVLGALKAVAVSALALLAFGWALGALAGPTWPAGVVVLLAAACVLVLEAVAYAMGGSYAGVLGEHGAAPEFTPFARHGSRVRAPEGDA